MKELLFSKQITLKYFSKLSFRGKKPTKQNNSFFGFHKSKRKDLHSTAWEDKRSWSLLYFQVFTPLISCFRNMVGFRNLLFFFLIEILSTILCTFNRIKRFIIPSCLDVWLYRCTLISSVSVFVSSTGSALFTQLGILCFEFGGGEQVYM